MKFKIGDKVQVKEDLTLPISFYWEYSKTTGTVQNRDEEGCLVDFDKLDTQYFYDRDLIPFKRKVKVFRRNGRS